MFSELGSEYGQKNSHSRLHGGPKLKFRVMKAILNAKLVEMKVCSKTAVHIAIVNFPMSGTVSDKKRSECPKNNKKN